MKGVKEVQLLPSAINNRRVEGEIIDVDGPGVWQCKFCEQRFQSEARYMKHHCRQKERVMELATPAGQAAFSFYLEWMRQRKFSAQSSAAFLESKFYGAFIKFAHMVAQSGIGKPEKYIALMVECDIQPVLWCSKGAYELYSGWYDSLSKPMDQAVDSIKLLLDICERDGIKLQEVFTHLGVQRILQLIHQRRLSPWFLFSSDEFKKVLRGLDRSDLKAFDAVVNASYFRKRFSEAKVELTEIKKLVKEIGF